VRSVWVPTLAQRTRKNGAPPALVVQADKASATRQEWGTPAKIAALGLPLLCRALPFFVIGGCQSGFIRGSSGVLGRGEEERTVVTAHAPVAPDKSEKEERARSIQPRHRLNPRTINFKIAAVRTALQPNSKHESITHYFSFATVSRRSELKKCAAS
jgi:hypothetical protein